MNPIFTSIVLAFFALPVFTHPHSLNKRGDEINDITVLNYALTLEHLENAFYSQGLAKYDEAAFTKAGLPSFARGRFVQVAEHEKAHVDFLSTALGEKATKPCTYKFPHNNPNEFVALSMALEGVGVSAYAGAAKFITNKDYLTVAAVVLSTEARHAGWVSGAVRKQEAWSGALDIPLGFNEVYSLASKFIVDCPKSNPALPVQAYPTLEFSSNKARPGSSVGIHYQGMDMSAQPAASFIVFYTGLSQIVAGIKDGKTTIPKDLKGTVYAVVKTGSKEEVEGGKGTTAAGPAILNFAFDSRGKYL